jgi:hypothetical protein
MAAERPSPKPDPTTRREILKRAAYVAPVILTLAAVPAFAAKGSSDPKIKDPKIK